MEARSIGNFFETKRLKASQPVPAPDKGFASIQDNVTLSEKTNNRQKKMPGPEFFASLHNSATLSLKQASASLDGGSVAWSEIKKVPTSINDPLTPPFQASDGSIHITDSDYFLTLNGNEFNMRKETELKGNDRPYYKTPQYDDDGTALFVAQDREHIKVISEGMVLDTISTPEYVSTPLALSVSSIAYGMSDGAVLVVDRNGKTLRSHHIPTVFTTQVDPNDRPVNVRFGKRDRLYVHTDDQRLFCFGPEGKRWDMTTVTKDTRWEFSAPFESADGSTLFVGGDREFTALDPSTGQKKWSVKLTGKLNAEPVQDDQGNIYIYSGKDNVSVITPDGLLKHSFSTGTTYSCDRRSSTRLSLDGNGNICLQAGKNEFCLFTAEGSTII